MPLRARSDSPTLPGSIPRTIALSLLVIAITASWCVAQPCYPWDPSCGAGNLQITVATDQPAYYLGDPIKYLVTATNHDPTPVTLWFSSSNQFDYEIDGIHSPDGWGLAVITNVEVPASGSYTWTGSHNWDEWSLEPGTHSVVGEVVWTGVSEPVSYEILATPEITSDVSIDFDTFPNGDPTLTDGELTHGRLWRDAFARQGVRFSSEGGTVNLSERPEYGGILRTPTTSYPPGFNVIAEFDMPVYGVSNDALGAGTSAVRLRAYDADDRLLGVATSDPETGVVSFASETPIAWVQWFGSSPQATVWIDNLLLNVDGAERDGDFNGDGVADQADYAVWLENQNRVVAPGWGPDADRSGVIDTADLAIWQVNRVPEPSTQIGVLACVGLLSAFRSGRSG